MDLRPAPRRLARTSRPMRVPQVPSPLRRAAPHPVVVPRWTHLARQRRLALRLPPLARPRRRGGTQTRSPSQLLLGEPHRRATRSTSPGGTTPHPPPPPPPQNPPPPPP